MYTVWWVMVIEGQGRRGRSLIWCGCLVCNKRLGSSIITLCFIVTYEVTYCEVSSSQVKCPLLPSWGGALCESPMSAVQGQFLECSSVCGPRASVPEPGDMSHYLISSTNQRCHMRECHIRAYVNYLISLVNVIVQHSTQPNQSQSKRKVICMVIWSYV